MRNTNNPPGREQIGSATDCASASKSSLDQTHFTLKVKDFQRFEALLGTTASSSSGLARLMSVRPPWLVNEV